MLGLDLGRGTGEIMGVTLEYSTLGWMLAIGGLDNILLSFRFVSFRFAPLFVRWAVFFSSASASLSCVIVSLLEIPDYILSYYPCAVLCCTYQEPHAHIEYLETAPPPDLPSNGAQQPPSRPHRPATRAISGISLSDSVCLSVCLVCLCCRPP